MKKPIEVKAWAIVRKKHNQIMSIGLADYFSIVTCDCCAAETDALAIYSKRKVALYQRSNCSYPEDYSVVPITITF